MAKKTELALNLYPGDEVVGPEGVIYAVIHRRVGEGTVDLDLQNGAGVVMTLTLRRYEEVEVP